MKKSLLIGLIAMCAAFFASPALAYYPSSGDLIKVAGNPAVYYIDNGGYRHLFPTGDIFFSWYSGSWKDQYIKTISGYEFNQLMSGKNVTARPGSALVKFSNSQIIYAVTPSARLCYASSYYDNFQYNRAMTIPAGFQSDYFTDSSCNISYGAKLPDGTLLRYRDSSDVYYIQNGYKRHVTSYGMSANNFRYESVLINVDSSVYYPTGSDIDSRESSISDINSNLYNYNYNSNYYNNYNYNVCRTDWSCTDWTTCLNHQQNRECLDLNRCNTTSDKPIINQYCY